MTDFQSGSREEIRYARATEQAATAATDMTVLPHSGNPTGPTREWTAGPTDEVTADLSVNDNIAQGYTVPFAFQNVFRYGLYELPMESVFGNEWVTGGTVTGSNIASAATGNKFTGPASTFNALKDVVPCHVKITRDGSKPISGIYVATKVKSDGSELEIAGATAGGITLTDVAAGDAVTIHAAKVLRNGSAHLFAIIERAQLGLGHFYAAFGAIGTQMDVNIAKGSTPTISFNFQARDADVGTATFGTGTQNAAGSHPPFDSGSGLKYLREGGAIVEGMFPQSCNLSFAAPVSAIDPAGIDGPYAHSKNRMALTGELVLYTNDAAKDIAAKADARTDSSLQFGLFKANESAVTKGYMFWIPAVQYVTSGLENGGIDGVVTTKLPWAAKKHSTYGFMVCVTAFDS